LSKRGFEGGRGSPKKTEEREGKEYIDPLEPGDAVTSPEKTTKNPSIGTKYPESG